MKRFITEIKKYYQYSVFQAKQDLKTEVANSYLNWLWWVFDPLFHMLTYAFVSVVVFKASEPYFPVFVFLGLCYWEFFNRMLLQSVKIMASNKSIITKVYIPKHILILERVWVNGFKMCISFSLVVIMLLLYGISLSVKFLAIVPITLSFVVVTFGLSTVVAHFGVFAEDLKHVLEICLKFTFYFTGIFYSIGNRVPYPFSAILLTCNPVAFHINELRKSTILDGDINWALLTLWFIFGCLTTLFGIRTIYKYENSYVKVI